MEVGDRILKKYKYSLSDEAEIIEISQNTTFSGLRYKIRLINKLNIRGTNVESWVSKNTIELDTTYYQKQRIDKINNILGESD